MKSQLLVVASCLFSATVSAQVREDVVTRAFQISHCRGIEKGVEGRMLRRLLTPELGMFEYFPGSHLLVVKDTAPVIDGIAALLRHYDQPPKYDLVTRAFRIAFCAEQLSAPHGSLYLALRRILTPKIGHIEFDRQHGRLTVKDIAPVVEEIASIIEHEDVEPRQILLDVRFVTTEDANLWKQAVATSPGADEQGFDVLSAKRTTALLALVQRDSASRIVRAPQLLGLDHREASIAIAASAGAAGTVPDLSLTLVPHIVARSQEIVMDLRRGDRVKQVLIRSGQTIAYRYLDADKEVIAFVTARAIEDRSSLRADLSRQISELEADTDAEQKSGDVAPAPAPAKN